MSSKPTWDPLTDEADAIVVGTGPGGATVGHGLAAAGRRVLFCELGGGDGALALRGQYPELAGGRSAIERLMARDFDGPESAWPISYANPSLTIVANALRVIEHILSA